MGKNLVSYGEFYKWKKANKLPEFYQKFSKRPDAQFDEDGALFICYDSEGRDVWLSPEGEIFGDTYNVYENKSDNKVMKHMYRLWNQNTDKRQHLSDDEINNMLSSDEKTDNLYSMMKGKMSKSKNVVKLGESQLRKIISKVIKDSLGYGEEYYICSETDYNGGKVDYWIGNKSEAEECNQYSEGSAIGPFSSYGEALDYANENGMSIPDPDNEVPKFSKSEIQGDEISRLYNNYSLTGQLPSDEDIKRVTRISESKIRKAISESIKKVLKEGEFDTMDWDYAANSSNELEDKSFTPFNGEGFQKRVYDNDDRQEILWAIKHFLTNDISSDAARLFERNEQLWQAAWENVDAYLGSDKEEFIRQAEQMKYSLPNGWTLDDVFNVVKDVKMGLQRSDTLAESKRTIKLNESQLRNIISKSVKKVLKEYELSDREKGIMRGYWSDVENRRMPKEKYEPYKPQSQKTNSSNSQKPKRWKYNNKQGK